jgi:ferrous iron transport protein A
MVMPLGLLSDGEGAEIVGLGSGALETRAEDMGLRAGKRIVVLANAGGPVLVKVDESRIAVARGVAMKIKVRTS